MAKRKKGLAASSLAATQQPRLFGLPDEVERDSILTLLGPDLAISLGRLRRTCSHGRKHVDADLLELQIDNHLADKGIQHLIAYDIGNAGLELRLLYIIPQGGDWAGWAAPLICIAKHRGREVRDLPIRLSRRDVSGVGSRALFDERCEALRQLSLICRHLNRRGEGDMTVKRAYGNEHVGRDKVTIHTEESMEEGNPFRAAFDASDPVCEITRGLHEYAGWSLHARCECYASLRTLAVQKLCFGGGRTAKVAEAFASADSPTEAARYDRMRALATQQPLVWNRHSVGTSRKADPFERIIVLHGDQAGHTFEAHILFSTTPSTAQAALYTTERPVAGKKGAARFPQTVQVALLVMGADAEVVFGDQLAVDVD